ncbi:hypothetical protein ACQKEN_19085 [Pseudomonas sp. NPDC078416]|uniref:hypothetical protein n=1 Tax=Pseudomonas sp. NPDC078416 TaxID=3390637 RepID=UPI003CFF4F10
MHFNLRPVRDSVEQRALGQRRPQQFDGTGEWLDRRQGDRVDLDPPQQSARAIGSHQP